MAHTNRTFTSNLHRPSMAHSQAQSGPSPALLARVQEKRVELENLKELRDLSAGLASQMRALEEKLATLADGTEVKVPKPRLREGQDEPETNDFPLPQTLVRIPVAESALSEAHQR
ncbi:MAG: hypothetical protein M1815_003659 [Lichina confinis]|nr:MAG: hypothetical protein M1815_003659 [Lichina confinis]